LVISIGIDIDIVSQGPDLKAKSVLAHPTMQ
jgi:hypothetical protein